MDIGGLIVGLGNPGDEYRNTRHNFGFMVVEALLEQAERFGSVRLLSGKKDAWKLWRCPLAKNSRKEWLVAEPLTYMNKSGEAVQHIAAYYRVEISDILVLHDELDLPLGRMKLKKGGGSAGHNGIRSLEQMLGSPDFYRLRLGVGKPPGMNGASWVLGRFYANEQEALASTIQGALEGLHLWASQGPRLAQQYCNGFVLESAAQTEGPQAQKHEKKDGSL